MNLSHRINAFRKLGIFCRDLAETKNHSFFQSIRFENEFFTKESVIQALLSISNILIQSKIERWISSYDLSLITKSKNIGVFLAGNIPLVGFHDFLCVLILNHKFIGKLSSKDSILFKYLVDRLLIIEPRFKSKIFFQSNIFSSDIFICTGNDFTTKYLDFNLKSKPRIIRDNKTSIAILDGKETEQHISLLMKDIFLYFGLGCRNVSKLYIPRNYDIQSIKKYFLDYSHLLNHVLYFDNYRYHKTIYNLKNEFFLDFESVLLLESRELFSPISVLYYEYYDQIKDISLDLSKTQCIISRVNNYNSIFFGESQKPGLSDYADNIDTIDFLLKN